MKISSTEIGSGDPLLLLHGFCETRAAWMPVAESLATRYNVIIPDVPGFGESESISEPFDLDVVGRIFLNWLSEKQISEPVVIGHSLGGYITLSMAKQDPARFSGIGLFHSTAAPDPTEKKQNRNKSIAFVEKHGVRPYTDGFVTGLFHDPTNLWIPKMKKIASETAKNTVVDYTAAMRDRKSSKEFVAEYDMPVLFVAGEFDELIPAKELEEQSKTARNPFYRSIKAAAHMGMLENEPESRNAIENFMNLVAGR